MIEVLIVEDEEFVREGLKLLIPWEEYGFHLCGEAPNGKAAIEIINNLKPSVVITDIRMPFMGGLELVKYCNENIKPSPLFIIMSGFNDFSYAQKAIKYKVESYILKPIDEEELISALTTVKSDIRINDLQEQNSKAIKNKSIDENIKQLVSDAGVLEEFNTLKKLLGDESSIYEKFKNVTIEELKLHLNNMPVKADEDISDLDINKQSIIIEIEKYIRENYDKELSLKSIAAKFFINSIYLGQLFKKNYGMYFNDYLHKIRIEKSKKLLLDTNMKIYEIANSVGYKNSNYFFSNFEKITGITPTQYKNNNEKR